MEFKELEVKSESSWLKRIFRSQHTKRSLIFAGIGAVAGFLYFYLTEGRHMDVLLFGSVIKSILIGGLFGFILTNSPCARNRC